MGNEYDGLYVTVEGIDGSGKSTVVDHLAECEAPRSTRTAEPYEGTRVGGLLREHLSDGATSAAADMFLFFADRAEHLNRLVVPELEKGRTVISDRGGDSTYAYQAHSVSRAGIDDDPWELFDAMYGGWDVEPDLTILLDLPPEVAMERADGDEKYEDAGFLRHARDNYVSLAGRHPDRFVTIDADRPVEEVNAEAAHELAKRLDDVVAFTGGEAPADD